MKYIIALLIIINTHLVAWSQSYIGGEIGTSGTYGVTLNQEIDTSYILMSLKTTIGENPTFKGRLGVKIGNPELHVVIYIVPIFNLDLKSMKYNTPFNAELRYTPKCKMCDFKFCFGTEIYKDGTYTYLNVLIPFK